jgi:hypothetical protein
LKQEIQIQMTINVNMALERASEPVRKVYEAGLLTEDALIIACDPALVPATTARIVRIMAAVIDNIVPKLGKKEPEVQAQDKIKVSNCVIALGAVPITNGAAEPKPNGAPAAAAGNQGEGDRSATAKIKSGRPTSRKAGVVGTRRGAGVSSEAPRVAPSNTSAKGAPIPGIDDVDYEVPLPAEEHRGAAEADLPGDWAARHNEKSAILRDLTFRKADVTRYIMLARGKALDEADHPEHKHGAAPGKAGGGKVKATKDPDSRPFVEVAADFTGYSAASVSEWCRIGAAICVGAYRRMLWTPLANQKGKLADLAHLTPEQQIRVADMYRAKFVREGSELLARYYSTVKARPENTETKPDGEEGEAEGKGDGGAAESMAPAIVPRTIRVPRDGGPFEAIIGDRSITLRVARVESDYVVLVIEEPQVGQSTVPESDAALTTANWFAVVHQVIDQLPESDRVTVGEVELVPPRACPTCVSTWEWQDGRCADCHPDEPQGMAQSYEHDVRRLVLTVEGDAGRRELMVSHWASGVATGLTSRADLKDMRAPVLLIKDHGFIVLDQGPSSRISDLAARLTDALTSMLGAARHEGEERDDAGGE